MRNRKCEEHRGAGLSSRPMLWLIAALVLLLGVSGAIAQVGATTVQGTVYRADGTPAGGSVLISWGAFTTAQNQAVAAGSLSANIGPDGLLSVNLTPNAGSLPSGSYYTVVYHLNDGTVNTEYWTVPASGSATIAAVRAQLQPSTVAVQSVTPAYVNSQVASLSATYVPLAGGAMSGPLTLSSDPTAQNQAATKHYADQVGAESLPLEGGTLTGPLTVPSLSAKQFEGRLYADQYGSVAAALSHCGSVCNIVAPPDLSATDPQPFGRTATGVGSKFCPGCGPSYFYGPTSGEPAAAVVDYRYGVPQWFMNAGAPYPTSNNAGFASPSWVMNETSFPSHLYAWGASAGSFQTAWFMGGTSAQTNVGGTTDYKNNLSNLQLWDYRYTQAQTGGDLAQTSYLYGNGDYAGHTLTVFGYGNASMTADEGPEAMRFSMEEGTQVFDATISGIATASDGSLTVSTTGQVNNGTQGEGRDLIDLTRVYNSGTSAGDPYVASIVNGTRVSGNPLEINCSGSYCDPNVTGSSVQTTLASSINSTTSGVNTFPESNVTISVASAAGFTTSSEVCIWGYDYDCETPTAVNTANNTITLAKVRLPQDAGAWVTQGGLAGYGFNLLADNCVSGSLSPACGIAPSSGGTIRWVIPIMASSGSTLKMFSGYNALPGAGSYTGRAYTSMGGSGGTCSVTVTGGSVSGVTVSGGTGYISTTSPSGQALDPPQLILSGITYTTAPSVYVTGISGGTLETAAVANAGAGIAGTPACTVVTQNAYAIYPMAKVWQVYNPADGQVDGTLWTEPPSAAFSSGDSVEEPHWYIQRYNSSLNKDYQDIPAQSGEPDNGLSYTTKGEQGTDEAAAEFRNSTSPLAYQGWPLGEAGIAGLGQWQTPRGYSLFGAYSSGLYMDTPPYGTSIYGYSAMSPAVLPVGCGTAGCSAWTNGYNFLEGQNAAGGSDTLQYDPATSNWLLTSGANQNGGRSPACSYGFGGSATSLSIACGNKTSSFDTSGDLSLGGSLSAQDVTGASINGEVTVDGTTYKSLNAAWNAAVNQAVASGQDQTVRLGPGTYPVSATLTEPSNGACVNLIGSGGTTVNADSPQVATTLTVPNALNGDVFYLGNTEQAQGCTFRDLNILAQTNATHGFELEWFRGLLMDNVAVNDTASDGIVLGEENTASGHQSNFLLRNVTVSFSSAAFTPANRPAYGIHIEKTAIDSALDNITVRNALTASVYNEGSGNTGYLIHGFGYPYTCATAPCVNNASSGSAANASYATSYVIYDTGGAGTEWTDTYVDSPAVAGFYVGANGVSIEGGHIQWPDLTSFPSANLAYVASSVTNNLLIGDVSCLGMASGTNWITYAGTSGNPPSFSSVHHLTGCGNYYQALEPAASTGFSSGGANINDPSGAVPRVWSTPLAAAATDAAYSAQMYTGYQGDAFQAHFSGVNPFFNVTYQGTIRSNGGLAMSTVLNTASTLTLTVANKNVIANAASGAQTITLPSCYTPMPDKLPPTGLELTIIKSDPSSNAVTLQTVSSENIDYNGVSAQTLAITSAGKRTLVCGPDYNWYAY